MVHGVIIHPNRFCIHLMSNMNLILRIMHLTVPCDVTVSLLPSSLFSPFMSVRWIFNRISSGQLAWILRRNDRNESRNEITFHLPRLFIPVDVSLSDSLLPWIDWFIGVSLCKYLFSSPSCFSPSSLPPLFLLVGLSLPLEKKSRWEMIFSFLFFFFLLPFCTRQFRNRADSLCVFECRTRRSSTKDLDLNFHLTSPF